MSVAKKQRCKKTKIVELDDGPEMVASKSKLEHNSVELPVDCLFEIFKYLSVSDRARVARVNKKWYEASSLSLNSLKSWKINYSCSEISFEELKTNSCIKVHCKSKVLEKLLLRFGEHVLDIYCGDIKDMDQLIIILNACRNIKEAEFCQMRIKKLKFQLSALDKLTDLTLDEIKDLQKDRLLEKILSSLRLTSLSICEGIIEEEFFKSLSPDIEVLDLEECKITNPRSAFNMLGKFKHLRTLTLFNTLPIDTNVELFIDLMKKVNLKDLYIPDNWEVVNDAFLIKLAKHADGLTELDISYNNVTDVGLNAVTNLQNLEALIIDAIQDIEGNLDVNLPNLKYFSCTDSLGVSDKTLIKFLNTDKIEYFRADKIFEEFILAAARIMQARINKIPLKVFAYDTDVKIISKSLNKIPKEQKLGHLHLNCWNVNDGASKLII